MKHLPRMLALGIRLWNFDNRYLKHQQILEAEVKAVPLERIPGLDEIQLVESIEQLWPIVQRIAYHNIIVPILMGIYSGMVSHQLHKIAVDPTHFDLLEGMPELATYSPDVHLRALHQQFLALAPEIRQRIREGGLKTAAQMPEAEMFTRDLESFTRQFGHLSDSGNDFTSVPWRERPDLVLEMAVNFPQEDIGGDRRLRAADIKLNGMSRWMFNLFHRRARRYRLYREQISSLYTYGYGLFRPYFLELGRRLLERGLLEDYQDIFYLTWEEAKQVSLGASDGADLVRIVKERKAEIEAVRDVDLPTVIYGEEAPPIIKDTLDQLTGIASSRGYYSGPARVVNGIQDFSKVRDGDVLVIPFSDVGWTPLFAHAGAVVAESGGMLSHASIIAREYNIPAVVSVNGAMRLADDTFVTVDGYKGEVFIHHPDENKE